MEVVGQVIGWSVFAVSLTTFVAALVSLGTARGRALSPTRSSKVLWAVCIVLASATFTIPPLPFGIWIPAGAIARLMALRRADLDGGIGREGSEAWGDEHPQRELAGEA